MLRAHRYGDQGNLGWQDHLEDHVNEATSKRKDVYGDCHPSFSGFQIRNTQAHRWVSWVLRGRRLYVHPVGVVQTEVHDGTS